MAEDVISNTAALFGELWHRYDEGLFEAPVRLCAQRLRANGFDPTWFRGKRCQDVGCGGGRYSIAVARLGPPEVVRCGISEAGSSEARQRAAPLSQVRFGVASVLELPHADSSFDCVCCSSALHHTESAARGMNVFNDIGHEKRWAELAREVATAANVVRHAIATLDELEGKLESDEISQRDLDWELFGWRHNRALAQKLE